MHRYIALAGLLFAPACLNPDISDEYPVTTESDALDGTATNDGEAEDELDAEAQTDEDSADELEPADDAAQADTPEDDVADTDGQRRAPNRRTWMRR